jgi:hypothetical protein
MVAGNEQGRPGEEVGNAIQLQKGCQGCPPARYLGPAGFRLDAALGTTECVGRGRQLAEQAAADVLVDVPAVDLAVARVVKVT